MLKKLPAHRISEIPEAAGLALLVWDLDGTLVDSRADLVASVNAMLVALHRPALPEDHIARYVGNGARRLVERALGLAPAAALAACELDATVPLSPRQTALADRGLDLFLDHYHHHLLDHTRLYPGVADGLAALAAAGFRMAVLTNKPVLPSQQILASLGVSRYFAAVCGGDSFASKKPDPEGLLALLARQRIAACAAAMIGDSAIDVRTGRAAGAWTCGVRYGFAPESLDAEPPDWIFDNFQALTGQLLASSPSRALDHASRC